MTPSRILILALSLTVLSCAPFFAGCSSESRAAAPTNPLLSAAPVEGTISGEVVAVAEAGSYTYVHIERDRDSVWVVAIAEKHRVGTQVTAQVYATRDHFESRRLDRTFEKLYFGTLTVH